MIDIPASIFIKSIEGNLDLEKLGKSLSNLRIRANQFPGRESREAYVRDNEYYRTTRSALSLIRAFTSLESSRLKYSPEGIALQKLTLEVRKAVRESKERSDAMNLEAVEMRARARKELEELRHKQRMEYLGAKENYMANRMPGLDRFGLNIRDLKNVKDYFGKNFPIPNWQNTVKKLKNLGVGAAITGALFIAKKTIGGIMKVSKRVLNVFTSAAKQAETFKAIMNLVFAPLVTMFTLLFAPLLVAMVPLIKTMFDWVITNKDAIMAVGDKFGSIFSQENLNMITKALDGVLYVLDSLSNIIRNNLNAIDSTELPRFISSTVLAITNIIQDVLMAVVAFCYSPEGQAFVKSVAYSVGKLIGSVFTTIIALLPVILESVIAGIVGVIAGINSFIQKAIFNFLELVDGFFGNAISGFLNTIVGLVNAAISMLNGINLFGFSPFNIPYLSGGSPSQIGTSISNFGDQSVVNNYNINNMMSLSNSSMLKDVLRTGAY